MPSKNSFGSSTVGVSTLTVSIDATGVGITGAAGITGSVIAFTPCFISDCKGAGGATGGTEASNKVLGTSNSGCGLTSGTCSTDGAINDGIDTSGSFTSSVTTGTGFTVGSLNVIGFSCTCSGFETSGSGSSLTSFISGITTSD